MCTHRTLEEEEGALRRRLNKSFTTFVRVTLFCDELMEEVDMNQWLKVLKESMGETLDIRGPAPAPIEKIKDEYRFHFWYFTPSVVRSIDGIDEARKAFKSKLDKDVREWIDVDPIQMT